MSNQITAHNAGWRTQFRLRGSRHQPGVCEFHRSLKKGVAAAVQFVYDTPE
jgi:hypothetical protein